MPTQSKNFISWFRDSSPYIHAHRGRTFVVMFPGESIKAPHFEALIHDIALLNSLGIKLLLVHGARPQINDLQKHTQIPIQMHNNLRITDSATLECVKEAVGQIRVTIEALLSQGLINTPMAGAKIRVVSGNLVTAQPLGVINGVDFKHTGKVRRIDAEAVANQLNAGNIVLFSPLGYSPSGEVFNLSAEEVACHVAVAVRADKLVFFIDGKGLVDKTGALIRQLSLKTAESLLADSSAPLADISRYLQNALYACKSGVQRVHLIDQACDGALLTELFTRDGSGTMITAAPYDMIRAAKVDDVAGIIELIKPQELSGSLVKRSRELLETEIEHFTVIDRDGTIIGCAALFPYKEELSGELACLTIHPDYQTQGHGERLLEEIENRAVLSGISNLFALTTVSAHWFLEQGFIESNQQVLPKIKQNLYNFQRNSKVFVKKIPGKMYKLI